MTVPTANPSRYIHGSDATEQSRLSRLNRILNDACVREMAIEPGSRILDIGSGLGQLTRDMARAAGRPVLGVERDQRQIDEALRQAADAGETPLLEIRRGDAASFPLRDDEWGSFDLVHARFVLEHVTDPQRVVDQMARAARPGGHVVLSDDDHSLLRLRPEPPGAHELWKAYCRAYDRLGCDPTIGTRLVEVLVASGLKPRRSAMLNFGACAGEPHFADMVENFVGVVETARPTIIGGGLMTPQTFDDACDQIRRWGTRSDAAIWYPLCWAEAVRP